MGLDDRCDFIIGPVADYDTIIFNELTESSSQYIRPYTQRETGIRKMGKLAYAKGQLKSSIDRFYECSNFLDSFKKKIALFSYRLTDKEAKNPAEMSMKKFQSAFKIFANVSSESEMPHGFVFEQRVYDKPYIIQ
jgi:hypothetical protein